MIFHYNVRFIGRMVGCFGETFGNQNIHLLFMLFHKCNQIFDETYWNFSNLIPNVMWIACVIYENSTRWTINGPSFWLKDLGILPPTQMSSIAKQKTLTLFIWQVIIFWGASKITIKKQKWSDIHGFFITIYCKKILNHQILVFCSHL